MVDVNPVTEALRIYLAAGWDANWEVVAGRMYRALANQPPPALEVVARAQALGYQVVFHAAGITLQRYPRIQSDTWGFLSLETALGWIESQEKEKTGLTRSHTAPPYGRKGW